MYQMFRRILEDHDPAILLIALLTCAFGALISMAIGQRALLFEGRQRQRRLCLAGLGTGLTIWSAHFSAMLAYDPGVPIPFNAHVAIVSACITVLMCTCSWFVMTTGEPWRGYLGGALMALAVCVGHFLDLNAMRLDGNVTFDLRTMLLGIAIGFPLCVASGAALRRGQDGNLLLATACLSAGTIALHLVAMGALRVVPTVAPELGPLYLHIGEVTLWVIATSAAVLFLGAALALHDLNLARVTALDREQLRISEEHHRLSVELSPQIPWIANEHGEILEISPRWAEALGIPVANGLVHGWMETVHPDDVPNVDTIWQNAIRTGSDKDVDVRYRLMTKDGSWRWFRARAYAHRDDTGRLIKWYGILEDIHDQVCTEQALRVSEERYRLASLATNEVIWDIALDSGRIDWSGAVGEVLGYPEAARGTTSDWALRRIHPDDGKPLVQHAYAIMDSDVDCWTHEFRFRREQGDYVDLLTRGHITRDSDGKITRMVGSLTDITARNQVEADLRWAAHHDPLTHLPNRKLFSMRLDAALIKARESGKSVGLVVIDVDQFKMLNDALGHGAGDALLVEVARRLTDTAPQGVTVSRLGGDEFAIILPDYDRIDHESDAVKSLLRQISEPFSYDSRSVDVSLSMGTASYPRDGSDHEALLKSADLALYAAKSKGPGHVCHFAPEMREAIETEKRMLINARRALVDEQIVPFYQPKICLRSGKVVGFEALLRWHHKKRGLQSPGSIQAAFDDPRIAPDLTDRMLGKMLADVSKWLDQGYAFGRIAFNSSPEDFRRGDLPDRILGQLADMGVPADHVELELTETVFLGKHSEMVATALSVLREERITVALDDFGTGYASLTHLNQFPVDVIKIDKSFVSRLVSAHQQEALIVGAVIDLAKNLGIKSVAEGVESELQIAMLHSRGCDVVQGYFISRPLSAAHVSRFLDSWEPERFLGHSNFSQRISEKSLIAD